MIRTLASRIAFALCAVVLACSADKLVVPFAPPTLAAIGTAAGVQGTTVTAILTGTHFIPGATSVVVSGTGVSVTAVTVSSVTSASVTLAVAANAQLGAHTVSVMTAAGTSAAITFTVNPPPPTLTAMVPGVGVLGTTVNIGFTGTNFVAGATTVTVSGTGITVQNVSVSSSSTMTADFIIAADATLADRTVTITTAGGTSGAQTFAIKPQPPTLTAVSPATAIIGTIADVTLTGTNFVPGSIVVVSGTGVVVTNVTVASATSITAKFTVALDAPLSARTVTVTTAGGTTTSQSFTVIPPAPATTSITPAAGVQGTAVNVTISGTSFVSGATSVAVSGAGVTVGNITVASSTSLTATFTLAANAAIGARTVTVTTAGGTTNNLSFTVNPLAPTLTTVAANTGAPGTSQTVTLTGTNFVAGATVGVTGTGVTVTNVNVVNGTTITADFAVAVNATLGGHSVTVTTSGGTSGTQIFTVLPPPPSLVGLSLTTGAQTGTQTITLTGTNFITGATTVNVGGANVTPSNVNVSSGTTLTVNFAVAPGAALGARLVTVTTAGGTSGPQTFTVVAAPTITTFNALATHLFAAQPARFRWSTSNAATCSIDNGVGVVSSCNDSVFVTPGTTRTYTLSATSAGATVTANFQLFANEPGRFVYWTSSGGAAGTHVHQASLDATTGDLTAIGTGLVGSGTTTLGIAVDPSGRYAYVANSSSNSVSMYSIDQATGALTQTGSMPAGTGPREIVVDPTGRFAYVINGNGGGAGSISRYTIDGTGLLVANGTTALGTDSRGIGIDATGRFLYATNQASNTIQEFSINADGTLSSLGTVTTSIKPYDIAIDPSGRFLYLTHNTDGKYSQYSIGTDGSLTLLGGGAVNIGPGTIQAVAVDPTARFTYMTDFNNAILHEFSIDQTTGILTRFAAPTLPHTLPTTQTTVQFAIDPQGKFAYTTDSNNGQILLFTIDANGVLAPVTAPLRTIAGGTSPFGIVVSR